MISIVAREFVYGGHLLALGTSSIAAFSAILLGHTPTLDLLIMAYLFSYGAYSMNRSAEFDEDRVSNPKRTSFLASREKFLPAITALCFAVGYLLAFLHGPFSLFFFALLVPLLLSVAYSVGSKKLFGPLLGVKRLKEKTLWKNIAISFGWSLIPLLVGLYYQQLALTIFLLEPFVFLRLFVNTIFFDVRDFAGDLQNGVRTLPGELGFRKTHRLLNVVDLISSAYLIAIVGLGFLPLYSLVALGFPLYSVTYRRLSLSRGTDLNVLCDVIGDGEYLLWGALLLLGRIVI